MRNRKFIVFCIACTLITALAFFNVKDANAAYTSITTITLGLFCSNVVQKNEHFNKIEEK